jgi:long-chain acyl-CoA synthetase
MSVERPWTSVYPSGVPANIDPSKYQSIIEYVSEMSKKHGKKPAFSCMGKEISFKELDKLSNNFAAYLQSRGLVAGDKVAIMLPNILQYPVALFGILKAGLVLVNTNPLYMPREMEHQFNDSGAKGIIILENFCSKLEEILLKTQIKTIIVTSLGEMLGSIKGSIVNFAVKNIKRMVPKYNLPNAVFMKSALAQGSKFKVDTNFINDHDTVIALQYTGGTTGVSKGAMLTNKNLIANCMQAKVFLVPYLAEEGSDVFLSPLPLYHIFAFTVNCLVTMDIGALSVLVTNPRDLKSVVKEFERYNITAMTGVNTLFNALLNFDAFTSTNLSSLKLVSAGGTALQKNVADKWEETTNTKISEGYGMTETSPIVTVNPKGGIRIGSVGIPVSSTDVRIVDDGGNILAIGETGEIQVKGPQVMKGYYNRPEETANNLTADGWLSTGDIGVFSDDGYLSIVDRKKDMILVSGFNVYPNEIEDVIGHMPKVLEVAAIGVNSEKSGECVKVFIVKKESSLSEDEVISYCKENLTGYKVPKFVEFKEDLPKSNVGKILRRKLKDT